MNVQYGSIFHDKLVELVTMFINIDNNSFSPTKQEVANTCPDDDRQTQPDIVGHEYQHQTVTNKHLYHV